MQSVRAITLQAIILGGHERSVLPIRGFHWVANDNEDPRLARRQLLALQMGSHAETVVQPRPHGSELLPRIAFLTFLARQLVAWQPLHKWSG